MGGIWRIVVGDGIAVLNNGLCRTEAGGDGVVVVVSSLLFGIAV
jgi:hypothetical protein